MLNYFKAFIVFLIWATIALTSHFFISNKIFNNCSTSKNADNSSLKSNITNNNNLYITTSTKDTLYQFSTGVLITKNKATTTLLKNLNDSVTEFLNKNYNKEIYIIGKYLNSEINNSTKNIGLERANFYKNELLKYGVKSHQIKTNGIVSDFSFNENNTFKNGVQFQLRNLPRKTLDSIEKLISSKILHLNLIDRKLTINKKAETYNTLLKQYLKKHPTKKVYITGHTSNKGYFENNLIIGLQKATALKNYFILNNILEHKIIANSKGEAEPIANKYTIEGKAKNNRIEIKIN